MIKRVIVKSYKCLRDTDVEFRPGLNIVVGDNECGKSTLLEAINLGLTGQLNRRPAGYELHPYLFNKDVTAEYVAALRDGQTVPPPHILVEIYFEDTAPAELKGDNNTRAEDCSGVKLRIQLDDKFAAEYETVIASPEKLTMVPVEYYHVEWESFALDPMHIRSTPIKPVLIDPGAITNAYAANRYVVDIARDFLSPSQQANLALTYRHMRELFHDDDNVSAVNEHLRENSGEISDKALSVGLDMTAKAGWDASILPHLDELPLSQVGKGEQNAVKIKLALKGGEERPVLLLEEPENHLSHTNLNRLIAYIAEKVGERQMIVTTHNSFVLNKLGIDRTLMFDGTSGVRLSDLPDETRNYFLKLPGHDTLRMVLAAKTILVEGPSDELVVQKAYKQRFGRMPLEDGVEVITVNSLAFKRFLDIAKLMQLQVRVVTDNDGNLEKLRNKYEGYFDIDGLRICFNEDEAQHTLEPSLLAVNSVDTLNEVFETTFESGEDIAAYMEDRKTQSALRLFESDIEITMPQYIQDAIE
ncbi:ATP-dependent nuclease [Henriciella aquimarina]|uniref:ATP-dependent nuclease n=1 Tax=Henriciella aquimarina TaxID=545261 RepID=UPI000A033DB8|nr:AAA family ATPase [Henriciella aquimarina]